jgi:hypothetical protein
MEHLKQALAAHGIPASVIDQLAAFESRDGLRVLDEVEFGQMQEYLRSFPIYQFLVPFLTDDNSNYWCLYVGGPLKNMTCYLSHEEVDLTPRFRSLASFLAAVNAPAVGDDLGVVADALFDFPSRQVSPTYAQDQEIIRALYTTLGAGTADDERRKQTAFALLALTAPPDIETTLYPFLDDEDMYVQERAIELLGFHRYQPAQAKLTELVTTAQHNGQLAAKIALQKIVAARQA